MSLEAVHSAAKYTSAMRSEPDGFQIKVSYCAILTKLTRPRAYVKFFPGANDFWEKMLKKNVWLQHLPSDELAPVDIPCFSVVKPDSHRYTILDIKDDIVLNLPFLISSNPCVSKQIFIIFEHLSR